MGLAFGPSRDMKDVVGRGYEWGRWNWDQVQPWLTRSTNAANRSANLYDVGTDWNLNRARTGFPGAAQIRQNVEGTCHAAMVDVFLMPPSMMELERRLRNRGTETEEQLAIRLGNAAGEMAEWRNYRYVIVSGHAAQDFDRFRSIMTAERMRSTRLELRF